jgi:2-oxoglutarate ferredoxin oxidoreductase subunit gamma
MIKEIRMSGSGGQGVVLAGIILAEAAGIYEGREAIHMQDYGGAMRGGAVRSEVLIADPGVEIVYPAVTRADILLAMTQEAANRWSGLTKADGIIVYDSTYVKTVPSLPAASYLAPITKTCEQELGSRVSANIVALGVICSLAKLVSEQSLEQAVLQRIPKGTEESNRKALKLGFKIGQEFAEQKRC